MLIARLIAEPSSIEEALDALTGALANAQMPISNAEMLVFGSDVLQIECSGDDLTTFRLAVDAHFSPSDAIISRGAIRVPDVFVSDMDSTMIGQECIDELADFAGLKDKVAEITERAMQGELDFESALRERVGLLKGLDEGAIARCLTERIVATAGARTLVQTLKSKGCRTALVTGGFHHFADHVAEQIGFERVVGNRLDVAEGQLTGGLIGPITDSATKQAVLEEERDKRGSDVVTMSAGDGANDIPMLEASTYGIAYRAKPKARSAANGWVDYGDLSNVLKLLGIPDTEWVA